MITADYTRPSICNEGGVPAEKWVIWYPYYSYVLQNVTTQCFQELHSHPENNSFQISPEDAVGCPNAYDLITCVQNGLPEQVQLAMASAQVLLGLTPTLLTILSPSVGEISMLSSARPLLAFLISMGRPAVYSMRALEYDDPVATLKIRESLFSQQPIQKPGCREAVISICQYLLAVASIANVVHLSWQLGLQTVVVWKAGMSSLVFLWSTCATVVHAVATLACFFSPTMEKVRAQNKMVSDQSVWKLLMLWINSEMTICSAKKRKGYLQHKQKESMMTLGLNVLAGVGSFILLGYGTIVFSSLLFISPLDVVPVIFRYLASTIVSRSILMFELSGLVAIEVVN